MFYATIEKIIECSDIDKKFEMSNLHNFVYKFLKLL